MSRAAGQEAAPPDLPGYRFISRIGAGGNAKVYLYEQDLPRRKVAVKVLNESAPSDAARSRFTDEANVTAGLAHRHIVQVFEANVTADGRPYLVMPYYPQPNLSVRARRAHFSVADVLRIGIQIGSAVETSHRSDVLHRDIKPQNILTDSYGEPVLTDFGIATTMGGDGPEGLSVPWSPPEILYGTSPGDQRADVYSLAATLWHLIAGRSPFEVPGGDNGTFALMRRIKADPPPRTQRADVPENLERLLRRAMAKDPAGRPQSAMELIRGLQSVEQELRLPLTQPILPASEPSGDTRSGDTIVRPQARAAVDTQGGEPGAEPAGDPASGAQAQAGPQRPGRTVQPPEDSNAGEDPTRRRGPVRLDPWNPAGQADEDPTRLRAPARVDPLAAQAAARSRVLPPESPGEAPGEATADRTAAPDVVPPGASGAEGTHRRGRVLAIAVGGALLAAVAGVAIFALGGGHGQTAPPAASQPASGAEQNALGPGATAPGQPAVTTSRLSAAQVKFSWTYDNPAASDTFEWQRVSGTSGTPTGEVTRPELILSVPSGQSVCLEVRVTRADGEASGESQPVCWSN